ncbi:MAG TPA: flavodoxin family protein [Chloroflexi bacterium]|jgi:multimeric flavodoxin WrbA|nr:flavodoxin family protein [Chloroflexota bacterium]
MSVLILNASPHPHGSCAAILHAIESGAGGDRPVEWVDVHSLDIAPCQGCKHCRTDGICVQEEDDAQRIGRRIEAAESLVIGTPTYWGNVPGPLKLLFDRTAAVFLRRSEARPQPPQQTAAIVTTCDSAWPTSHLPTQGRGAIQAVRNVLASGGYRIVGTMIYPSASARRNVPPSVLRRAVALGRRL